jgi:hypothetical protein
MSYGYFLITTKIKETEKIITSVLQKDFSLFPKEEPLDDLKNTAIKLYYQSKEEQYQLYSYKNLYDTILNKLEIGLIILNKNNQEKQWNIFYCNPTFMNILKVPKYNEWSFYEEKKFRILSVDRENRISGFSGFYRYFHSRNQQTTLLY